MTELQSGIQNYLENDINNRFVGIYDEGNSCLCIQDGYTGQVYCHIGPIQGNIYWVISDSALDTYLEYVTKKVLNLL
ncbi:hypothetical protein [Elizabethkingia phage TCUEAP1]|nr:hypothetical protein [Elizabethkingia phage TCUEAP1]